MSVAVPAADVLRMARRLLRYPDAHICVHSVAADLLDALERSGMKPDADFAAAAEHVVNADDDAAIAAIDRLLAKHAAP